MKLPFHNNLSTNDAGSRLAVDKRIGAALANVISKRASSLSEVAEKTGISEELLNSYINGTNNLPSSQAILLADTLGFQLDALYSAQPEE